MNASAPCAILALLTLSLASCATSRPAEESQWNCLGLWTRVSGDPPTYIPKDYPASKPRTEASGTWFVDHDHKKKLFVPHSHLKQGRTSFWAAEAYKATGMQLKVPPKSLETRLEDGASGLLLATLTILAGMGSSGVGVPSGGGGCH